MANWGNVLRQVARIGAELLSSSPNRSTRPPQPRPHVRSAPTADRARTITYAPDLDGAADPGEIVWAWVPFEEVDGRGKDRPLLVVGRGGSDLLGLMLSSQHDRADDANWLSVGSGAWDRRGRESFVRLDRVLEVGEHDIRREGAVLDRDRFERVASALRTHFGWA
ncbi:MAG TPA: type II toxin-antitoxin system PemK/MazF family toxin [Pseudonocardia sp.]|nr:type II toxin-antitoxin system PemK/MazF family toxin [Pseudonocardia sp.]